MQKLAAILLVLISFHIAAAQGERPSQNKIQWAFPTADELSVVLEGESYSQLAPEVFGKRLMMGESKNVESALILFTPKIIATIQLLQISDPERIPDIDRLLAMTAIKLAVKTPNGSTNEYKGKGMITDRIFYIYSVEGGRAVGASVSPDHRRVLVIPAPNSP